jgi:hypothetical protein
VEQVNTTSEVRNRFGLQSLGTQFHNPLAGLKNPNPKFKLREKLKKTGGVPESGAGEYYFRSEIDLGFNLLVPSFIIHWQVSKTLTLTSK